MIQRTLNLSTMTLFASIAVVSAVGASVATFVVLRKESKRRMSTLKVWVYNDPDSGVEIHMEPGIGEEMEITWGLLAEFNAAHTRVGEIEAAILTQLAAQKRERKESEGR